MEEISVHLTEIHLLKSIPGIGDKLAAAIVAEIEILDSLDMLSS